MRQRPDAEVAQRARGVQRVQRRLLGHAEPQSSTKRTRRARCCTRRRFRRPPRSLPRAARAASRRRQPQRGTRPHSARERSGSSPGWIGQRTPGCARRRRRRRRRRARRMAARRRARRPPPPARRAQRGAPRTRRQRSSRAGAGDATRSEGWRSLINCTSAAPPPTSIASASPSPSINSTSRTPAATAASRRPRPRKSSGAAARPSLDAVRLLHATRDAERVVVGGGADGDVRRADGDNLGEALEHRGLAGGGARHEDLDAHRGAAGGTAARHVSEEPVLAKIADVVDGRRRRPARRNALDQRAEGLPWRPAARTASGAPSRARS